MDTYDIYTYSRLPSKRLGRGVGVEDQFTKSMMQSYLNVLKA
jgi:hypothetical protein